ncbi:hypothetical protein R1sor_023447 [Riccia sorocarpa]|uniref:Aminotransferase-like plant mobile domain-containing protein n=1 Tax=Riccia sorocarpa TaxID=122646 RepID=A0ABD3GPH4_9MARC
MQRSSTLAALGMQLSPLTDPSLSASAVCLQTRGDSWLRSFTLFRAKVQFVDHQFVYDCSIEHSRGVFNTDASDERLLITGADGRSNVIGWTEIMTAFGGDHSEEDEFRGAKIMHKQLLPYRPSDYLPEQVEKNLNKGLVSGKDYEEVLYYREAAPYGPTYYLMTVIAEVFWSHSRSNRFLMPMVYAYLRVLYGHPYNWAKAILKSLKAEITYLQKEAWVPKDSQKTVQVVWAPVFVHLLYTFRHRLFAGTAVAEPEAWVCWRMMTKEGDMNLAALVDKFPTPIDDLSTLREGCKLTDPDDLPKYDLAGQAEEVAKKMVPKKNRPQKVVIDASDDTDPEGKPAPKRRKPDTPGPRVRYTKKIVPFTPGPATPSSTAIRSLDDLAAAVGEDIKRVVKKRCATLLSHLGVEGNEWKLKFESLQKSTADGAAKQDVILKGFKDRELQLSNELAKCKAEVESQTAKVLNLQSHVNALNESVNDAKRSLAEQAASVQSATRAKQTVQGLQDELARFRQQQTTLETAKTSMSSVINNLTA